MNDREKERIEKCVVQIECINKLDDKDIELGTGFFIEKNIIITAGHVINKYYTNSSDYVINVTPIKADIDTEIKVKRVIESERNNFVAILELEETVEIVNPLKFTLGYQIKRDDEYFSFGHPQCKRLVGYPLENKIATTINGNQSRKVDWDLKLTGERLEDFKGFSGSPVIIDNMLIGIVQTESDAKGKTISIGMSSIDIMKQYIACEFFEEYNDKLNTEKFGSNNNTNGYNNVTNMDFIRKVSICKTIKRLLIENYKAFIEYGPKSENAKNNPLSNIYEIWEIRKREKIVPNNTEIIQLISENKELFNMDEYEVCCEFIEHAEGFEKSCYSIIEDVKQFPNKFEEVINNYAKV